MFQRGGWMAAVVAAAAIGCADRAAEERLALGEVYTQATAAIDSGDFQRAVELLDRAAEMMPNDQWTFRSRALAHARLGQDDQARADVEKCLAIDPTNADASWIQAELEKPRERRFQGRNATPPSAVK